MSRGSARGFSPRSEAWPRLRDFKTSSKSVVFLEATLTVATSGSKATLLTFKM